ncbi:Energy-coupling factor transporter ATP-binding protein EcfA1 [Limihaloglobus sulfuriphilus]|uniref:Energy-coupling factor transporter ATP-binding protein EcfA1 n=1 Tax=Limihaloglobus sulfuriphilus TaxID=1851148 RepID=A0A1Q2MDF3_9BACT|nr:ATP-binding cassette domain-containing protein [Limihaloglobus sulfuriphilus]AQQ70347.1 Energy-coupling factor transporter ATP-binding protein EcfA1 [Limihaloglobus sulfuriphilus]
MIKFDNITVKYNSLPIIEHFSLDVEKGEKVAVCGPSGSGKSSILQIPLGFVLPESGAVTVDNILLSSQTAWQIRIKTGYVPQEPDLSSGTVRAIINAPFNYHTNHNLKSNLEKLPGLLEEFALDDSILDKEINTLSGGEKQRIALIIALLLDRDILLLDEISSALDPDCRKAVINHLAQIQKTILLVTHDTALLEFCDRKIEISKTAPQSLLSNQHKENMRKKV